MNLSTMRARVERLRDLALGMGKEVALWQAQEGPLLPLERKRYLEALFWLQMRLLRSWRPPLSAWRSWPGSRAGYRSAYLAIASEIMAEAKN